MCGVSASPDRGERPIEIAAVLRGNTHHVSRRELGVTLRRGE